MLRYNPSIQNNNALVQTDFLDFSRPKVTDLEADLFGHFFSDSNNSQAQELQDFIFVDDATNLEKFSILSSRGTTTLSNNSSDTYSTENGSQMDKSHKLTEATKDTSTYCPSYEVPLHTKLHEVDREIFLISKFKKRAPRRSFDLGELTQSQVIIFEKSEIRVATSAPSQMFVDKEKVGALYNKLVDEGHCQPESIKSLNATETQILEVMLKLRLTLTKTIKESYSTSLLSNLEELNLLLSKSTFLKKRSEELLKKNFKTVLKMLLDNERKLLSKGVSALQSRNLFTNKYFGSKAREYDRIFKCIQMSQDYYSSIFKFEDFKNTFSAALSTFMDQFYIDRVSKTENLIAQIKSDLISRNHVKSNLRTPWSLKEAEASMKLMSQFL